MEKYIDDLKASDHHKKNKVFRKTRKLKGLPIVPLVLLVGSIVVAAGFFGFFVKVDTDVDTESLLSWNGSPGEEYMVSRDVINATCGNTYVFDNTLKINDNADGNRTVYFHWVSDPELSCSVLIDDMVVESYELEPGETVTVQERYVVGDNVTAGSYSAVLTINII